MKKILLSIAIISALSACQKEKTEVETTDSMNMDSAQVVIPMDSSASTSTFKKVEWTPEETTKMLGKMNNDTLYVNNFFATWCGPCMVEIPHFKVKMEQMKNQPVKFTFISLDSKDDWDTKVKKFAEEQNLSDHIVLLDGSKLQPEFFPANFKQWDGGAIPFTFIRKGDKTDETLGAMSEEMLSEKLNSFK
jgi:thiol-disulfide isomerase/thioredoxin